MDADAVIKSILASPVWHILYPFKEGECCYIMDGETWDRLVRNGRWEKRFEEDATHAKWLLPAMGIDIMAQGCALKPYFRDEKFLILDIPDREKVRDWADKIGKYIIMHRLEGNASSGYTLHEQYRVGRRKP